MARSDPNPGTQYGKWLLVERLGAGGNGVVWKATSKSGEAGAIKFLQARYVKDEQRNRRFRHEINAMRACSDIAGVLPLLDSHSPSNPNHNDPAWLVSAYATPLDKIAEISMSLLEVVRLCLSLAQTLAEMHSRGFSHRDIKPGNIFDYNGSWCLGDFGLVDFPEKSAVTREGEKLGPAHYIAPEMLNGSRDADGSKADVYSLGKLFWKLATGQQYPLPGMHIRNIPALTISANVIGESTSTLDGLLEAMTHLDPQHRPAMSQVVGALSSWLAPPPTPGHITDLAPYTRRVSALTDSYQQEQERRRSLQEEADSARGRAFKRFSRTMGEIKGELERANIGRVTLEAPTGGNGEFYWAVTGNQAVGRLDRTWLFQFEVNARIDAGTKRALLRGGVNLGVRNIEGDPDTLHDIYAPVLAAAGYTVSTELLVENTWKTASQLIWGQADTFFFGQPTEAAVLDTLAAGLTANLTGAVEALIAAIETLPPSGRLVGIAP